MRGKNLNMYLMDGKVNGRMKCTLSNWTGLVFKIPRTALDLCKNREDLKQTGVYFLFGKDEASEKNIVYIGQAGIRKNGEGILNRLLEHDRISSKKDYWTEAVAITTSNDSLGPTEISYLEHRFCQLAKEAKRYEVKNNNEPTSGNPSEEKQSELEDFIDYAKIVVGAIGHKVFEPLISLDDGLGSAHQQKFYCRRNDAHAIGVRTAEGFVVKKGSKVSSHFTPSCPENIRKLRDRYANLIKDDGRIGEDILFNSPSGASAFVTGSSSNGYVDWKTSDGATLKAYDAQTNS